MDFATLSEDYFILPPSAESLMYSSNDLISEDHLLLPPSCNHFISFFRGDLDVVDIPKLFPPNINLPIVSRALNKENSFLLLQQILYLKKNGSCSMLEVLTCLVQINHHHLTASVSRVVHRDHKSISTECLLGHRVLPSQACICTCAFIATFFLCLGGGSFYPNQHDGNKLALGNLIASGDMS